MDTDGYGNFGKSLKARGLGDFPNYLFHPYPSVSIGSMRAPRREKKAPRRAWGREARLAACGAIIPNCDHARKVGGTPLQHAMAARRSGFQQAFAMHGAFQRSSAATAHAN